MHQALLNRQTYMCAYKTYAREICHGDTTHIHLLNPARYIFSHHSIFVKVLIKCRAIIGEGVGITCQLKFYRVQLEDLSRQMHDEVRCNFLAGKLLNFKFRNCGKVLPWTCAQVSETENIRKNLSIERMIVEGCDILLDVNQVFVRQGTLVQVT